MGRVNVNDRIEIIQVSSNEQHLLHKSGRVVLIADEVTCVVALDEGGGASVNMNQLRKVT